MSWEDDEFEMPPETRDQKFDRLRKFREGVGLTPGNFSKAAMEKRFGEKVVAPRMGLAEMRKVYEAKTGQSGLPEHGPMARIKAFATGQGRRKTRRGKKSKRARSRGRTRYASAGSRKGKN